CLQHNVACDTGVADCVYLPGTCMPDTGRCVYDFKPDDTACDDGRSYTVGDLCRKGKRALAFFCRYSLVVKLVPE
ncbi:MAG: hypothetical protein VX003_11155, partial [SAR324 cluster bacterium]|nr:hypothetical protein [SAR324 cluster bacterium]